MDLSVVVITLNEEADLPGCLDSVKALEAEIVVVDNHSADKTAEIARQAGASVHSRTFDGYAPQKQAAVDRATRTWVLNIDADERVSPELAREIGAVIERDPPEAGFEIPFEVHYLGRALRFGGMGSERHLRLFRRDAGRFVGGLVHEGIDVRGPIGRLSGRILHFPYRDLEEHRAKIERYTSLMAEKGLEQGRRVTPLHRLVPYWEFFVRYVLKGGFLDGAQGFTYAKMAAFYTKTKYEKLAQASSHEA